MVMQAVMEMGVPEIISKAGVEGASAEEIATQLELSHGAKPKTASSMVDRMLYLLASHSILTCTTTTTNEPIFLWSNRHTLCFQLRWSFVWAVNVQNKIYSTTSNKGFDQLGRLVDVGGGLGVALKLITSKYPQIKGISFDLPHVIQHTPHYPGVEHIAGDMFESVPEGDAIFFELATSSVLPMVMQAVMEMGVLEIISKAGVEGASAEEIASQLELSHDATPKTASSMLDRMLYLLASHSILTCTTTTTNGNRYGLGPIGIHFVPNSDGVSYGPLMSCIQDKVLMPSWAELKPAVIEGGIPFNKVYGINLFEYLEKDARFNEVFNKGMINFTTILMKKILNTYKGFDQLGRLVDVGGGLGVALKLITSKYPQIKGISFDLPHVIQHTPNYPGVEHIAGDMFESVPEGDAIFMKNILHDWSDDRCLKLLSNCYKALPDQGKVIIVEMILPTVLDNTPSTKATCQNDVIMMAQNPGGKERTEKEYLSLATAAGFAGIQLICFFCNLWVMEFYK